MQLARTSPRGYANITSTSFEFGCVPARRYDVFTDALSAIGICLEVGLQVFGGLIDPEVWHGVTKL